jgi:hypothetical protein
MDTPTLNPILDGLIASVFDAYSDDVDQLMLCQDTPGFNVEYLFKIYEKYTQPNALWQEEDIHFALSQSTYCLSSALKKALSEHPEVPYPQYDPELYASFLKKIHQIIYPETQIDHDALIYSICAPCQINGSEWIIPPLNHAIYLTKANALIQEIPKIELNNLLDKITLLDEQHPNTWQHILWTNCKTCMPETVNTLHTYNNDYTVEIPQYSFIEDLRLQNFMGIAVDTLRLALLNHFGGFYSDLNYKVNTTPAPYMKSHTLIATSDCLGTYSIIENNLLAATPGHPIMQQTLQRIDDFFKNIRTYELMDFNNNHFFKNHKAQITHYLALEPLKEAIIKYTQTPKASQCILPIHKNNFPMNGRLIQEWYDDPHFDTRFSSPYCYTTPIIGQDGLEDTGLSWL